MALFRLLHASDLHLSSTPFKVGLLDYLHMLASGESLPHARFKAVSSQNPQVVRELARFAYAARGDIDAIVLSGDLATTGDSGDLQEAHALVANPATKGHLSAAGMPSLLGAGKDIALTPGNHDRFDPEFPYLPGDMTFDHVFRKFWSAGQGVQRVWEGSKEGSWLVLIGADFTLKAKDRGGFPTAHFGRGRAEMSRVNVLEYETRRAMKEHDGCCILWILHFHPRANDTMLELLEAKNLKPVLSRLPVSGILCGHTHESQSARFGRRPVFVCGSTTQYYAPAGNDLQIVELDVSPKGVKPHRVSVTRFRYDPKQGFVP